MILAHIQGTNYGGYTGKASVNRIPGKIYKHIAYGNQACQTGF